MAAARATLSEVLTDEAYANLDRLAGRLRTEVTAAISEGGFPWHVVTVGAKGCVTFKAERVRDYRDFLGVDDRLGNAHWLIQHNGGVFLPPWGKIEQWLLSVQHTDEDVDRFVRNFVRLTKEVA
jgi:glutamate-1-semialdehyde 2,1-aminomutase